MTLAITTDFEEAGRLLGIYYQEVAQTGIFDYPTNWEPQAPLPPPSTPENPAISNSASVNNFDLSCDLPSIPSSVQELLPPATPVIQEKIIVIEPSSSDSSPTEPTSQSVSEVISSTISHRQKLTEQQAEERQLLYLYIQEIENTGNIAQIPNFLRIKR